MLRSISLVLLSAQASLGALSYAVPQSLAAHVASSSCTLAEGYVLNDFVAQSADDGKTLVSYDFGYFDNSTNITSPCHFNSTSKPINLPGRTPRFACDNTLIEFLYQNDTVVIIEGVCPEDDG